MSKTKPLLVAPVSTDPGVLLLTLNRPQARNAVTAPMIRAICAALDSASSDPQVKAVVITGAAEGRAFCGYGHGGRN